MGMDKALLEALVALGNRAGLPTTLEPDREPGHVYYLVGADGGVERREAEPPPRQYRAYDLSAIATLAEEFQSAENPVEVWYSRERVLALLDARTRRDRVCLPLEYSPQLRSLKALEPRAGFAQKDFVRLLRVSLAGCVTPAVVAVFRNMKFRQASSGEAEVSHTRSSIGRTIEAELTGAGTIPEDLTLQVPVWEGFRSNLRYPVACAVEVDPQAERFFLTPLPGAVEDTVRDAERDLGDMLREAIAESVTGDSPNVTVLYGTP